MINIEKSVVINRPVEEVFAFVTDGSKAPSWQEGLEAVEGRADVIGSQYTEVRKLLGREMRSLMEVTAFEWNKGWSARVLKGPVPYEVSVRVEPQDGGTRLTTRVDGEPTGFFKVAEGMVKSQLEKSMEGNNQRLKQIMEGQTA
jgi:uncharacterized protein YndB with AHSA1/START domain